MPVSKLDFCKDPFEVPKSIPASVRTDYQTSVQTRVQSWGQVGKCNWLFLTLGVGAMEQDIGQ